MIRENAEEDLIELGMLTDWLIKLLRIVHAKLFRATLPEYRLNDKIFFIICYRICIALN